MLKFDNKILISFGMKSKVYLIEKNNKKYIMKVLLDKNDNEYNTCGIINNLDNKYFVKFIEKIDNCIIYDLFEGDTLEDFKYKIDKDKIMLVVKQLVDFFILLRNKGYCYYDLSLNNILIDDNYNIKVIDYGSLYKIENKPTNLVGTYGFVSPEYFKDNILDYEKNYVFSLGIILFVLYFKYEIFPKSNDYFKKCWKWCQEIDCNRNNCLSKYLDKKLIDNILLKKIILNCLNFNYNERISINEIDLLISA